MPSKLEVITGPMFSRKSGLLLVQVERAQLAKKKVLAIKPVTDKRTEGIAPRKLHADGTTTLADALPAREIEDGDEQGLLALFAEEDFDVLIVDEAQFFELDDTYDQLGWFGRAIKKLLYERRDSDLCIYIAGLDMTWDGKPFNGMPGLCALADRVEKVTAICTCGKEAQFSQRLSEDTSQIAIGDKEEYEPRCRICFVPPP